MRLFVLLIFVFLSGLSFAQTSIEGKVLDESGAPIPGANIFVKDSYDGTSSTVDGVFSFQTDETGEHILFVTFVGYKSFNQKIILNGTAISLQIILAEEINQLDGVVISAGSFTAGEEKRRTILKPVDIATTAGATADIAGALNTLPGTQKVGESGRLFVRGGDGNETRTFVDGLVVLEPYAPSGPNTPSRGRFLPFMFKGTSFSTGGYSAEYGQALSSALVLNSKDIADANQTDIGILSVGTDIAHTQAWQRASLSAKVGYTNLQPYFGLINQEIDWITAPESFESSAAYRQKVGKDGIFKFFGNLNHTSFSQYLHAIEDPSKKSPYELINTYGYGNGSYHQSLNPLWSVRGGVSYSYNHNDVSLGGIPIGDLDRGIHTKLVFENAVTDQLEIHFGGEYYARSYSASRFNESNQKTETLSFNEPLSVAFAEAEYFANKHFVVKAGGRFEINAMTHQSAVDPRMSLAYKPGKRGQFSFAYGKFRQTAQNKFVIWNNDLNPEKAEHFILNYQVVTDRKTFRVETYYKKYDQLIKFQNGNSSLLTNSGNGFAKGIEFFWRDNETIKNVDYWISYSFLDTKRDYLYYPTAAVPTFASRHNFSFVYKHFVQSIKSQFGVTYSYTSGRTYFNPNKPTSEFQSDRTPSYQDLSANVAYLPKSNLIFYVSCTNLLGRDNIFGYQYAVTPDAYGVYASRAIRQAATRFLFVGMFITFTKNKSINQLPNL